VRAAAAQVFQRRFFVALSAYNTIYIYLRPKAFIHIEREGEANSISAFNFILFLPTPYTGREVSMQSPSVKLAKSKIILC